MTTTDDRETKVELLALFATPVAITRFPAADDTNRQLRETILQREAQTGSTSHSNRGGWQSTWDFAEWCGAPGLALLGFIKALGTRLTRDRAGQPVNLTWRTNAWANINRDGHGNEFHTHPGAVWSAVYYVDDGGAGGDPPRGGELEIQDPRGVAPAMYRPDLVPAVASGEATGASQVLAPTAGNVVMFPSWLSHGVRPYHGTGVRISISVNLST